MTAPTFPITTILPPGGYPSRSSDSGCFSDDTKCITIYKETGCKGIITQYQCAQAYYQKQQNLILKSQADSKLQQENTELKSQLQEMQKTIESLKTQQTSQTRQPQNNLFTASVGSVPMPYLVLALAIIAVIAIGIWKKFFRTRA